MARCAGPRPTRPSGLRADTLPTLCGGGAAARPVTALQAVTGNVAAKAAPAARPGQVGRLRCSGAPFRAARPSPQAGRFAGLAPLLPLAGCGVGAPARPGPHGVGAVGPSAPPARAAALRPALPARPRLRRRPCRAALPAHSPHGVAAPRGSRWPASGPRQAAPRALGRLKAAVRVRCPSPPPHSSRRCGGPQFIPPRALAAQAPPSPRFARGGAQGYAACGRECRPLPRPARPRQAPRRAASRPQAGALPAVSPASVGNRGGCPALWRVPARFSFWGFGGGCFGCRLLSCVPLSLWPAVLALRGVPRCGAVCVPSFPVGFVPGFPVAVSFGGCGFCLPAGGCGLPRLARWLLWCCSPPRSCSACAGVCACVGGWRWLLVWCFWSLCPRSGCGLPCGLGAAAVARRIKKPHRVTKPVGLFASINGCRPKNSTAEVTQGYESEIEGAAPVGGFLLPRMRLQISFHSVEESARPAE